MKVRPEGWSPFTLHLLFGSTNGKEKGSAGLKLRPHTDSQYCHAKDKASWSFIQTHQNTTKPQWSKMQSNTNSMPITLINRHKISLQLQLSMTEPKSQNPRVKQCFNAPQHTDSTCALCHLSTSWSCQTAVKDTVSEVCCQRESFSHSDTE